MFKRDLETQVFDSLQDSSFFLTKLKPDILSGTVFSAIRRNYMDFYHKGGCLFRFQKEFTTHRKYASVVQSKSDYVSENDLQKNVRLIQDFAEGYEEIKQTSYQEGKRSITIYHSYSFLNRILMLLFWI